MSATEVFDRTLQETNIWLDEIMEDIGPNRHHAYHVLRAVRHTLHDDLTVKESMHLPAQLPHLVRAICFVGWNPSASPGRERTGEEFPRDVATPWA